MRAFAFGPRACRPLMLAAVLGSACFGQNPLMVINATRFTLHLHPIEGQLANGTLVITNHNGAMPDGDPPVIAVAAGNPIPMVVAPPFQPVTLDYRFQNHQPLALNFQILYGAVETRSASHGAVGINFTEVGGQRRTLLGTPDGYASSDFIVIPGRDPWNQVMTIIERFDPLPAPALILAPAPAAAGAGSASASVQPGASVSGQ